MKRSNFKNLISDAYNEGWRSHAGASIDTWWPQGKWQAEAYPREPYSDNTVIGVWHRGTELIRVVLDGHGAALRVIPIDSGWGSSTDRCGVRKITAGAGISTGYRELFNC